MGSRMEEKMILRHTAVSLVLAKEAAGQTISAAIDEVLKIGFVAGFKGERLKLTRRSLFRWVKKFCEGGFEFLATKSRKGSGLSQVLDKKFIEFLVEQKNNDEKSTVPDIIRSAEKLQIVKEGTLSRTTVWRVAQKLNLPLLGIQKKDMSTKRRFEYKHRMQMVLCDGKHFRAGVKRRKRVVFTFIDDSTRKIIGVVVGRTETKLLFLRGLQKVIRRYGKMACLYMDNGSGFISGDGYIICARLGIHVINGTEGYPEGHGKIERFNRTMGQDLLRTFAGDPSVDDVLSHLEIRIEHYVEQIYNTRMHGSLRQSPNEKWQNDSLGLKTVNDLEALDRNFVITKSRKVSEDNIIKLDGLSYEMPLGHSGRIVNVEQDLLHNNVRVLHEGKMIRLLTPNLPDNAHAKRVNRRKSKKIPSGGPIRTSARIGFDNDYASIVTAQGDFSEKDANKIEGK